MFSNQLWILFSHDTLIPVSHVYGLFFSIIILKRQKLRLNQVSNLHTFFWFFETEYVDSDFYVLFERKYIYNECS